VKTRPFYAQRPLVVLACIYGLGVLAGAAGKGLPIPLLLAGLACALCALLFLRQSKGWLFAAIACGFFFLGLLLSGLAVHPVQPVEGRYQVSAIVSGNSEIREADGRVKALLRGVSLMDEKGESHQVSGAYWTYYPPKGSALPGDGLRVEFTGKLYHPQGQTNPYGFDFRLYLLQRGVSVGLSGGVDLKFNGGQPSLWYSIRRSIAARLDSLFGEDSSLAKALLIGEKDDLNEEVMADFRDAGIAHVLAVSGLHVSLMMSMVYLVLQRFHLSPKALLSIIFVLLLMYCRLLDFTPSVVRASILTCMYLAGKCLRRRTDPLTALSAAFLLILLVRPLDLFNIGFQLSFLAVLGIFTLGDAMNARLNRSSLFTGMPGWLKLTAQAYVLTLAASLMTAVQLVNAFQRYSLIGLLVGPLACLLIGWLMAGYILTLLLSLIYIPLASLAALFPVLFARLYQAGVSLAARTPGAVMTLRDFPWYTALLIFALLFLFTRYVLLKPGTKILFSGVMLASLLALAVLPSPDTVRYIQLSAGDADSAVMRDGRQTWVIDAGEHGGELSSFLLSQGLGVDRLFLTHLHSDHVGGLRQLMDNQVAISEILLPYGAREALITDESMDLLKEAEGLGIPVRELGAGDVLSTGKASARVLWPERGALYPGQDPNDGSLVLLWDLSGVSLLTAGDLSGNYARYALREAQVLKAAHHGSAQDNDLGMLKLVSPQLALISASAANLERNLSAEQQFQAIRCLPLVTGKTGAVTLQVSEGRIRIETHLRNED
jgi:competence protein ComEC